MSTPAEAGRELNLSADHIRALIAAGELEAVNVGMGRIRPRYRIPDEAIEAFRERRSTKRPSKVRRRARDVQEVGDWV